MAEETVSLEWIGATLRQIQGEQRVMSTEPRDMRTVLLGLANAGCGTTWS